MPQAHRWLHAVGQLATGDHQRRHDQQEDRDRDLHACTVVSTSLLMSLIITFMFEPAKLQMNWARASGTSTLRKALDGRDLLSHAAPAHAAFRSASSARRRR